MVTSATPLASASLAQSADTRAIGKGKDGGGSDRYSSLAMSSAFQGALWDVEGGSATVKGSPKKEKVITPSPPRELGERRPTPGKPMGKIEICLVKYWFCSLFIFTDRNAELSMVLVNMHTLMSFKVVYMGFVPAILSRANKLSTLTGCFICTPCTGGDLRVTVDVKDMLRDDMWPQLDAKVFGKNLHGPLIDRILEIPMDIHEGRANGYIQIQAFDTQTWVFPKIDANIRCTSK